MSLLTTPTTATAVQLVFCFAFLLMGLSHLLQPRMWREFFAHLHSLGTTGVVYRTFMMELIPASVLVAFHQVWHGVAVVITVYGWLLLLKVVISMLYPAAGLRSLAMAEKAGDRGFIVAGTALIALSVLCALASRITATELVSTELHPSQSRVSYINRIDFIEYGWRKSHHNGEPFVGR
ncbi:MAG: hypothetical protein AAGA84_09725 [Pseudomonadota bacterium]